METVSCATLMSSVVLRAARARRAFREACPMLADRLEAAAMESAAAESISWPCHESGQGGMTIHGDAGRTEAAAGATVVKLRDGPSFGTRRFFGRGARYCAGKRRFVSAVVTASGRARCIAR